MQNEIVATLNEIFSSVLDEDVKLELESTAEDVEGWDSLNHVRLMVEVERTFKIKLSAAEISRFKNVGDLVQVIEKKKSA
jgi:acyl carrier protein